MRLIHIIRIISSSKLLLLVFGLILSFTVYLGTRNERKTYSSSTVIYTGIATGFNLESGLDRRYDMMGTSAKFDNLINIIQGRETVEEVGISLLATHLIADQTKQQIFTHLKSVIPDSLRKALVDVNSFENTFNKIKNYKNQSDTNVVYKLLYSDDRFYSIKKISSLTVKRIQSSDLIEIKYSSDHAVITQQTLQILTDVFLRKFTLLQTGQTANVVNYFEQKLKESKMNLANAEQKLLEFKERNRIINFQEQTKAIAFQKEELDKDYETQILDLASARAALGEIESRLTLKTNQSLQSDKIKQKRDKLAEFTSKINLAEVYNPGNMKDIAKLKEEAEQLKLELRDDVEQLDMLDRTTSGIPMKTLLQQWLQNVVTVEESQAKADVILQRKVEFDKKYDVFAPLGSELNIIEREISIAEKEYLSNITSLSQSKLSQQNIENSSSVKVLDPPYYPLSAEKSVRKITVIASFFAGIILLLGILVLMEFLDSTIKTPERVSTFTKLNLLGIYPRIENAKKSDVDFPYISNRLVELMIQKIKLEALKLSEKNQKPFTINVVSTRYLEGKTFISELLSEKLKSGGNKVMIIKPYLEDKYSQDVANIQPFFIERLLIKFRDFLIKISGFSLHSGTSSSVNDQNISVSDSFVYEISNDFFDQKDLKQMLRFPNINLEEYDYVLVILPALLKNEFPVEIVRNSDMSILICRANRIWNKADDQVLELFNNSLDHKPHVVLNGCRIDYLDAVIGEIPKKRTFGRVIVKRLLTFDFWSKEKI